MTQMTGETSGEVLLLPREVMAMLNCDRQALYDLRRSGALPYVKLTERRIRYKAGDVRAVLAGKRPPKVSDGRARRGRGRSAA